MTWGGELMGGCAGKLAGRLMHSEAWLCHEGAGRVKARRRTVIGVFCRSSEGPSARGRKSGSVLQGIKSEGCSIVMLRLKPRPTKIPIAQVLV